MSNTNTRLPRVFRTPAKLIEHLAELIDKGSNIIISIDGKDGIGKSTLAKMISVQLGFCHIELDKFLVEKKNHYVDSIRYDELLKALSPSTKNGTIVIIDGICVLSVIDRLGLQPNHKIYVKKTTPEGFWYDQHDFDLNSSPETIFETREVQARQSAKAFGESYEGSPDETLFHEIVRYHFKHQPHITADFIIEYNHLQK